MAEPNVPMNGNVDDDEQDWVVEFALVMLADCPGGYETFRQLMTRFYTNEISRIEFVMGMEDLLLNYPQIRMALNSIDDHLEESKDLKEEWSDWVKKWRPNPNVAKVLPAVNPTVYESHLFRCFLTIKADINAMVTEDYTKILAKRAQLNITKAEQMAAIENAPPLIRPPSPIHPPMNGNAIKGFFKSVKEILNEENQPDERFYRKFKEILVSYSKNLDYPIGNTNVMMKLTKVGVCQEICKLFQNHREILNDFIEFLPHIGHISRNVTKYDSED